MGVLKKLEVGEFAHFSPGTGIGWRLVKDSDDPRKREWELVNTNTNKVLRTKKGNLSLGGGLIEWAKGGIRNTIAMQKAAEERNKIYLEEKSKTHYLFENNRGHKSWRPKTQAMLEAEARENNQVVEEKKTGGIDSEYQMPDFASMYTKALENPYLDDQTLYQLTEGMNLLQNLKESQFDTQTTFIKAAQMKDLNLPNFKYDSNLTSNLNKTDINTTNTNTNTTEINTTDTNTTGTISNGTGSADNTQISVDESSQINETKPWDKGQRWSRGSGTSLRDANAATLQIIKDQGYDVRGLGQFDQANLARDWRLGRFNNQDKTLFFQSDRGHKQIKKR